MTKKEKGRQWDGFKKEKTLSEMLEEGFKEEQDGIAEETN